MRVVIKEENEEAAERVRKWAGDRSPTETVNRLIQEADAIVAMTPKDAAHTVAPKRKGAK